MDYINIKSFPTHCRQLLRTHLLAQLNGTLGQAPSTDGLESLKNALHKDEAAKLAATVRQITASYADALGAFTDTILQLSIDILWCLSKRIF